MSDDAAFERFVRATAGEPQIEPDGMPSDLPLPDHPFMGDLARRLFEIVLRHPHTTATQLLVLGDALHTMAAEQRSAGLYRHAAAMQQLARHLRAVAPRRAAP